MATSRVDSISRLFAARRVSRESAAPNAPPPADWNGEKTAYLFVQSFEGGSIAPKAGEAGTYTVTLEHGLGQTLYFGDRPSRDVGAVPTAQFLERLGFPADNPPNAALVVDDGTGETEIAVVELTNPLVDPTGPAGIYDVKTLEAWEDTTELGLSASPAGLSAVPASFGAAHLFIDDCPDDYITCHTSARGAVGQFDKQGFCWNYLLC